MAAHTTCHRVMEGFLKGRKEYRIKERTVLFSACWWIIPGTLLSAQVGISLKLGHRWSRVECFRCCSHIWWKIVEGSGIKGVTQGPEQSYDKSEAVTWKWGRAWSVCLASQAEQRPVDRSYMDAVTFHCKQRSYNNRSNDWKITYDSCWFSLLMGDWPEWTSNMSCNLHF